MIYKIQLIKDLLNHVESFESKTGHSDIKEFTLYLKEKVFHEESGKTSKEFDNDDYLNYKNYKDVEFSTLLTGLFRFAKHYLKKTFQKRTFKTIDEFGFLASLLSSESFFKNELINRHHLEVSSGSEILKRLIKSGLIDEFPDENDKRAIRIRITEKGRTEIFSAFDDMYKVSKIVRGNMSDKELNEILMVLNKLSYFHGNIWEKDKNASLHEIYEKYALN
jgi:DNA-binding MarR family transcriptional regulator